MKILYLPPKYIDTPNLEKEHTHICMYLGFISTKDVWAGYLFLRLKMIEEELNRRAGEMKFDSNFINPHDFVLSATPNELIIRNEKTHLIEEWSTRMLEDSILELMDQLIPLSTEDLWLESEWLIEMHRKEYGL